MRAYVGNHAASLFYLALSVEQSTHSVMIATCDPLYPAHRLDWTCGGSKSTAMRSSPPAA